MNPFYHIHLKLSKEAELKVQLNQDYRISLLKILDKNFGVDSFFLAEILEILQRGQETIDLLNNLEISYEKDKSLKFNYIGMAYLTKGEYDKANEYLEKSLQIKLKTLGNDHPDNAISYNHIGRV